MAIRQMAPRGGHVPSHVRTQERMMAARAKPGEVVYAVRGHENVKSLGGHLIFEQNGVRCVRMLPAQASYWIDQGVVKTLGGAASASAATGRTQAPSVTASSASGQPPKS